MSLEWNPIFADSFNQAGRVTGSTGGYVGNGWLDLVGAWYVNASNHLYLNTYSPNPLYIPAHITPIQGQRIHVQLKAYGSGGAGPRLCLRTTSALPSGGVPQYTGYTAIMRYDTGLQLDKWNAGTPTRVNYQNTSPTTLSGSPTNVWMDFQVAGTTNTVLTVTAGTITGGVESGILDTLTYTDSSTPITAANLMGLDAYAAASEVISVTMYGQYLVATQPVYYVANAGSDSNNGETPATAFQTINKVNQIAFQAGGQLMFNAGDTFTDAPLILNAGNCLNATTAQPIVVSSFGSFRLGPATFQLAATTKTPVVISDIGNIEVNSLIINCPVPGNPSPGDGSDTSPAAILVRHTQQGGRKTGIKILNNIITGSRVPIGFSAWNGSLTLTDATVGVNTIEIAGNTISRFGGFGITFNEGGAVTPQTGGLGWVGISSSIGMWTSVNYFGHYSNLHLHHNKFYGPSGLLSGWSGPPAPPTGLEATEGTGIRVYTSDALVSVRPDDAQPGGYGTIIEDNYFYQLCVNSGCGTGTDIYWDGAAYNTTTHLGYDGLPQARGILCQRNVCVGQQITDGINIGIGSSNVTVQNNLVSQAYRSGISLDGGHPYGFASNIVVRYNLLIDNGFGGIDDDQPGGITFLITDAVVGSANYLPVAANSHYVLIYNNTILNHCSSGGVGYPYCTALSAAGTGMYLLNNLIYMPEYVVDGAQGTALVVNSSAPAGGIVGNLYFGGGAITDQHSGGFGTLTDGGSTALAQAQALDLSWLEHLNGTPTGLDADPLITDWTGVSLPIDSGTLTSFFATLPQAGSPVFGGGVDIVRYFGHLGITAGIADLTGNVPTNNIGAQSLVSQSTIAIQAGVNVNTGANKVNVGVSMDGV